MAAAVPPRPRVIKVSRTDVVNGPVVTGDAIYAGTKDFSSVRLDRRTLEAVWVIDSEGWRIGPAVSDELISVGGPAGGGVRNARDGRLIWSGHSVLGGAGIWNGFVTLGATAAIDLRDPRTGDVVRTIAVSPGYWGWICRSRALGILQWERLVRAFRFDSGSIVWERPLVDELKARLGGGTDSVAIKAAFGSSPDLVIGFYGGATFAISAKDGTILWHRARVWSPYAWPTVESGRVYALSGNRFVALEEATGESMFDVTVPELDGIAYKEKDATLYRTRVAFAHETGPLAVFDTADGRLVSLHRSRQPLWHTAEADGRLIVGTNAGTLLVFNESIWGLNG